MTAVPVWHAYSDTGALKMNCPHCGAEPRVFCSRDGGRVRRIPCVTDASESGVVDADSEPRDFSEPGRNS
jgi:hypothetical protein